MKEWLRQEIVDCIARFSSDSTVSTRWKDPLVGYADARDALFLRLKEVVSPSHFTPRELLDSAQTVIAYFLPFESNVVQSNPRGPYASPQWVSAYLETNRLIVTINRHLAQVLRKRGYESVALPPTHNFDENKLVSDWSHKHAAYIAGLGKFGLHQMLITEEGCCGRLGSLITSAAIAATARGTQEACLYKYNQSCDVCIRRCASGALTENGFDRHRCYQVLLENAEIHRGRDLADACGKCMSMVPCSFVDPVARLLKKQVSSS